MNRVIVLMAFAACVPAAELKLPPGFEPITRLAFSTPPEFAADGLLRLLESRLIQDRQTRIDLAQQAFDLAGAAHFRVALRPIAGVGGDTRQGLLGKAYALRLDTIALQSRAVMAMLPLDKTRARQMFQSMVKPDLPPLHCEDTLVYDPAAFYRALAAVAQTGFTAKERAKDDPVAFVLEYVGQVHSPSQLAPMLAALHSSGLGQAEMEAAVVRLEGRMEAMAGDYRSFSAALDELEKVVTPDMAVSFRKYVDRNQASDACPAAKPDSFWQSEPAKRILAGASTLRFSTDRSRVLSDAERATPEWQRHLADFEKGPGRLAGWGREGGGRLLQPEMHGLSGAGGIDPAWAGARQDAASLYRVHRRIQFAVAEPG